MKDIFLSSIHFLIFLMQSRSVMGRSFGGIFILWPLWAAVPSSPTGTREYSVFLRPVWGCSSSSAGPVRVRTSQCIRRPGSCRWVGFRIWPLRAHFTNMICANIDIYRMFRCLAGENSCSVVAGRLFVSLFHACGLFSETRRRCRMLCSESYRPIVSGIKNKELERDIE